MAATTLLHEGPPTAVITYNDRSAIGLLDGLARSGVEVPATVSVVGYDDSPEAQLAVVDLTTVSQDAAAQAEHAVAAAVERLDGGRDGVRSSSAPTWSSAAPRRRLGDQRQDQRFALAASRSAAEWRMLGRLRDRLRPRPLPAVFPPADIASLEELHAYFVEQVNEAVAEGRDDRIPGLVDAYWDEAAHSLNNGTVGWSDGGP